MAREIPGRIPSGTLGQADRPEATVKEDSQLSTEGPASKVGRLLHY